MRNSDERDNRNKFIKLNNKLVWKTHLDITPEKNGKYPLPDEWNEVNIFLGRHNGHSYTWHLVGEYSDCKYSNLPIVGITDGSYARIVRDHNNILVPVLVETSSDLLLNPTNYGVRFVIKYR